ncbi:hypothetical protein HDV00_008893 [Rhizophlyctis rosea]|nr:hypothetical protein HDV00_008893 [Rhizophlyctis rosea]
MIFIPHMKPLLTPALVDYPPQATYYRDRFPPCIFFQEHFEECVIRNFKAGGDKREDDSIPEGDAFVVRDDVGTEEESELELEDKFLRNAASSDDTLYDERLLI